MKKAFVLVLFGGILGFVLCLLFWKEKSVPQAHMETRGELPPQLAEPIKPKISEEPPPESAVPSSNSESVSKSVPSESEKRDPREELTEGLDQICRFLEDRYADPEVLKNREIRKFALNGIMERLEGSAMLISMKNAEPVRNPDSGVGVHDLSLLDPGMGYVRLSKMDHETIQALNEKLHSMVEGKKVTDLILDLRFSESEEFLNVPEFVSLFFEHSEEIFQIKKKNDIRRIETSPNAHPISMPMVLLVNQSTRGAFELFAAVMKNKKRVLIVGSSPTANRIFITSDIPIDQEEVLRLATEKFVLSGGEDLFLNPVKPDIQVDLNPQLEKSIFSLPFHPPEIKPTARYFSEAILTGKERAPSLVKSKKSGKETEVSVNQDDSLLTAIDVLKSMRVLGLFKKKMDAVAPSPIGEPTSI